MLKSTLSHHRKQFVMAQDRTDVHILPPPAILDSVKLRDIQLPLPTAPDAWHRQGKPQPCTASLKLSYSSTVAAAAADDVSLTLDYGKLYRRLVEYMRQMGQPKAPGRSTVFVDGKREDERTVNMLSQDVRVIGRVIADCALGLLDETAAGVRRMLSHEQKASFTLTPTDSSVFPIMEDYGQCEAWVHLPKALLRAEGGLTYRSFTIWGYKQTEAETARGTTDIIDADRRSVVLEEEFCIDGIRCHCIVGVNSHERVEKQAVIVSLRFRGPGQLAWGSTVVDTYQEMTRTIAEVSATLFSFWPFCSTDPFQFQRVEGTSFQTVEALATFIARIATVEFANERVTVSVEKPSALAFVQNSGVEITRTQAFFA